MNTAASIWLALAAISLAITAIHDHRNITPRKVLIGLTLGPVAVVLRAALLAAAAIRGRE